MDAGRRVVEEVNGVGGVREAGAAHVEGIRSVGQACWPDTYAFAGEDYIENGLASWWSVEATERSLRETAVVVAVEEGRIVGMGNADLRGETPTIWKLYVLAEMRGADVGTALLDALLDRIPYSADGVQLENADGNDQATRFYARRRFAETDRKPGERPGGPDTVWTRNPVPGTGAS